MHTLTITATKKRKPIWPNGARLMNAIPQNNQMFVVALANMAKTVELAGESQRFTWCDAKPFLKTQVGKTRQQKVMALAWKLYKGSRMTGDHFDRRRFNLYVAGAHAEVRHESEAVKTLSRKEIRFIGDDSATDVRAA